MERHLKERLIGATILFVLVVLLVPEFLSGPKAPPPAPPATLPVPVHTYTVDLNDPARATLQEPDSAASVAPAATVVTTDTAASTAALPEPPAPASVAAPIPAPAPAPGAAPIESLRNTPIQSTGSGRHAGATGAWGVQLGSFASKANAEKLAKLLDGKGYSAAVSPAGTGSAARFRVRIGQLPDREAAQRLLGKLQSQGHAATLVPPG